MLVLRRRWSQVLLITLACTALAAVRSFNMPAVYSSTVRLKLAREALPPTNRNFAQWDHGIRQEHLNTQSIVLRSASLAAEVLTQEPSILEDLEAEVGSDERNLLAGAFLSGVRVKLVRKTYLADVSYESVHPERCAQYANALANSYMAQLESQRAGKAQTAREKLIDEARQVERKLRQSEKALEVFIEKNDVPMLPFREELLKARKKWNDEAVDLVHRQRVRLAAKQEAIDRAMKPGGEGAGRQDALESAGPVAEDPQIQRLRERLAGANEKLAGLLKVYGRNHPKVKGSQARRDTIQEVLRQEIDTLLATIRSNLSARIAEEKGLLDKRRQLQEESISLDRQRRKYTALNDKVLANRRFYNGFGQQLLDLRHRAPLETPDVRILDQAIGSYQVRPFHMRNILMGLGVGLVLGLVAAFVLERLSDRIHSSAEAVASLQLPILGVVPEVNEVRSEQLDLFALASSRSIYAESFRRGRVQLDAIGAYDVEGCGVLLCTSGVPREGKTLCTINLAIAYAQTGKRTLLIDGDMRSPRTHKVFGKPLSPGLGEYLASERLEPDMLQSTDLPDLWVLTAGSTQDNPAELLARSAGFEGLINRLRSEFDRVLIDTPPSAAVSDGTQMATSADAVLLIVSGRTSSRSASVQACTELSRVGAEPCGVLFNCQGQGEQGGYYYYYSRYYNRYTDPNTLPPPTQDDG